MDAFPPERKKCRRSFVFVSFCVFLFLLLSFVWFCLSFSLFFFSSLWDLQCLLRCFSCRGVVSTAFPRLKTAAPRWLLEGLAAGYFGFFCFSSFSSVTPPGFTRNPPRAFPPRPFSAEPFGLCFAIRLIGFHGPF